MSLLKGRIVGQGNGKKLSWLAGGGTLLAVLAFYGTTVVVGALSFLGVGLVIHEGAWAGTISLFAIVALAGIGLNTRRHRVIGPGVVSLIGTAMVLYVMAVSHDRIIEIIGFAGLISGAVWDWRIKKSLSQAEAET